MSPLKGKNILIGVTGGIAAYKTPMLVRLLVKAGAHVKVVMSKGAEQFVTAETLAVLSKNEVWTDFFNAKGEWNNHVHLGIWADVFLVAPATANTLSKMASGVCDNLLMATYLSSRCKVFVSPAMDADMYIHPTTEMNLQKLREQEVGIIPAKSGELASGLTGEGRMPEPEELFLFLEEHFEGNKGPLQGKKVIVTAGPTYEAIDPVRFIGNRSSGQMGIAIADCLSRKGAEVYLILGPSHLLPQEKNVELIRVESAEEMYKASTTHFPSCDVAILAAAVADYKVEKAADQKIKKTEDNLELKLVKTQDILADLGKQKKTHQTLVGFALETQDVMTNAEKKLKAKNLDFIVANQPGEQTGFGTSTNQVSILEKDNKIHKFELKSKTEVAEDIVAFLIEYLNKK